MAPKGMHVLEGNHSETQPILDLPWADLVSHGGNHQGAVTIKELQKQNKMLMEELGRIKNYVKEVPRKWT